MISDSNRTRKVVGIFQHDELLHIHFYNLAYNLSQHYKVYVFTLNQDLDTPKLVDLKSLTNVTFINYRQNDHLVFQPKRILQKLGLIKQSLFLSELTYLINKEKIKFDYLFGIEKKGLVLMNRVHAPNSTRIYFSLELYNVPPFDTPYEFDKLRRLEVKYHHLCDHTVIQDKNRALYLADYNHVDFDKMNWIYLPVSIKGDVNTGKSTYLHKRLHLDLSKKIILNYGMVAERRYSVEVASVLNNLDPQYIPVFHARVNEEVVDKIRLFDNIVLSQDFIKESDLNNLISSGYIGISIYNNDDKNNKFTILSSEKNARYCQNGIPFICLYSSETNAIYQQLKYFEMVGSLEEIPEAIAKIDRNYSGYQKNAIEAFNKFYSFDNNFPHLLKEIE